MKSGLSRLTTVGIVIVIVVIILVAGYYSLVSAVSHSTTTTAPLTTTTTTPVPTITTQSSICSTCSTTTTTTAPLTTTTTTPVPTITTQSSICSTCSTTAVSAIGPSNSSILIDESAGCAGGVCETYDSLDPAVGFETDEYFPNVFQGLVALNPTNETEVVPSLASNWTVSSNYENYTFTMRANTWFSDEDPINAYVAWFSFVRELYVNNPDGVGISDYALITVNTSDPEEVTPASNLLPYGLWGAVVNAGHVPNNENSVIAALNQMLSNFNPSNATQQAIMSYPNQAYVAVSNSTFQINLIQPYKLFLIDIANYWGAMVDPINVDGPQIGGVQNNTSPAYASSNGMIGSGPYMYGTHSPGNTLLILNANPNYWAKGVTGLSQALEPPSIPVIEMQFGDSASTETEDFSTNRAQIATLPIGQIEQLWTSYHSAYPQYTFDQIFLNSGYPFLDAQIAFNTQVYPTNITLLRQALVHSVNYTEVQQELYTFNGTILGQLFLPPVPPGWGPLDNPQNIPLYSYNITLAQQLIAEAGEQNGFYVTLPNGTNVGDTSGVALPPIDFDYILPASANTESLIAVLANDLSNIGVTISATGVTAATMDSFSAAASSTPPMLEDSWSADWPDPIYQQFYDMATPVSHYVNWVNNGTLNTLLAEIPFETNSTLQLEQTEQAYQIFTQLSTMIQLPTAANYFFIQPYVHGVTTPSRVFPWAILYNMISYS